MTSKSSELFRRRVNMQSVNMRKQRRVATRPHRPSFAVFGPESD